MGMIKLSAITFEHNVPTSDFMSIWINADYIVEIALVKNVGTSIQMYTHRVLVKETTEEVLALAERKLH